MSFITGFEGTATAHVKYLHGLPRIELTTLVEGKVVTQWFDDEQLELAK